MNVRGNTIRDVARRAGVSVGTASKAFNNKGNLSAETRQRVLAAASELNFTPNALIRSLQRGRTYSLGLFAWTLHVDPSFDITMNLVRGVADGISNAGCDMLFYSHLPKRMEIGLTATAFLDGRIDGLVMVGDLCDSILLETLASAQIPTTVMYRRDVPEGIASVDVDNESGITQIVQHLVGLGHRRIAFYVPYSTFNYRDRSNAFRQAMIVAGREVAEDLCVVGMDSHPGIPEVCDRWFGLAEPPTAIVAGDDYQAVLILEELGKRGMRVPEDISVTGFDDATAAANAPGLTTVRQPAYEVGLSAVQFVERQISGESVGEMQLVLPVELVVRGTTAPPLVRG